MKQMYTNVAKVPFIYASAKRNKKPPPLPPPKKKKDQQKVQKDQRVTTPLPYLSFSHATFFASLFFLSLLRSYFTFLRYPSRWSLFPLPACHCHPELPAYDSRQATALSHPPSSHTGIDSIPLPRSTPGPFMPASDSLSLPPAPPPNPSPPAPSSR